MAPTPYEMKQRALRNQLRQATRAAALAGHAAWKRLGATTRQLTRLRAQNGDDFSVGAPRLAVHNALALLVLPACYTIDVLMMAAPAEFVASTAFGDDEGLVRASRFLVPLAVLMLDLFIGSALVQLADNAYGRGEVPRSATFALGLAWACVMPVAVLATNIAQFGDWSSMPAGNKLLTACQAALGFAAHAAVVFSARHMGEAKAHALFAWRDRKLSRKAASHHEAYRENQLAARRLYEQLQTVTPDGNPALAFDDTTRKVLDDQLAIPEWENAGMGVVDAPEIGTPTDSTFDDYAAEPVPAEQAATAVPQAFGAPHAPAAQAAPRSAVDAMNAHLTQVLAEQQRLAESEVRP